MRKNNILFVFLLLGLCANSVFAQKKYEIMDIKTFADSLTNACNRYDEKFVKAVFDMEAFKALFIPDAKSMESPTEKGFYEGLAGSVDKGDFVTNILVSLRNDKAKTHFLKQRTFEGKKSLLYSTVMQEGGVNYLEFIVKETPKGVKINDILVFTTGATLSQNVKDIAAHTIATMENGSKKQNEKVLEKLKTLQKAQKLMGETKYAEAYMLIKKIPLLDCSGLDATVRQMRLNLAQALDDGSYDTELEDFIKICPSNSALPLRSIDYYFAKKDYPKVSAAIEKLDIMTDRTDPYIIQIKMGVLAVQEKVPTSEVLLPYFEEMVKRKTDDTEIYASYFEILVELKKNNAIVGALNAMQANTKLKKTAIVAALKESGVTELKEFKDWLGK
jgi:hypothetical protein